MTDRERLLRELTDRLRNDPAAWLTWLLITERWPARMYPWQTQMMAQLYAASASLAADTPPETPPTPAPPESN
jgi:hypothetical protein